MFVAKGAFAHDAKLASLPVELINAVRAQAEADADDAVQYVRRSSESVNDNGHKLDAKDFELTTLIGFGLAVRFWRWESQHIRVHIDAGLPRSGELMAQMVKFGRGQKLADYVVWALGKSTEVFQESILWAAVNGALNPDWAIQGEIDERSLDAIADFLLSQVMKTKC